MTLEASVTRRSSRIRLRFDQAWVPRLGPEAAADLARLALLALLLGPVVILLSVLAGVGISSGRSTDLALGVAAVLAVIGLCVEWIRLSRDFAAAVSAHFGEEIGWRELPRFRPSLFDEWASARGLRRVVP